MATTRRKLHRVILIMVLISIVAALSIRLRADSGTCNGHTIDLPFTDVAGDTFFCQIAEAYFSGLTYGTDATHYSAGEVVPRGQMAAFITRTQDAILSRKSLRAALNMWATPKSVGSGATTGVGCRPVGVQSDGADLWVANSAGSQCGVGTVSRIRASDGKGLETWTGADGAQSVLVARGRIWVTGFTLGPTGSLYRINPTQPPGNVTVVTNSLGEGPNSITTDGSYLWTANFDSVSKINPVTFDVQNFSAGLNQPGGILYDGNNIWVVDAIDNKLKKLRSDGSVAQIVPVGDFPGAPVYDGRNIWQPGGTNGSETLTVVRASTGDVIATLTGNGLNSPFGAAFDGERILVVNDGGSSVSLWRATDFSRLGSVSVGAGTEPVAACSDGINFWIVLRAANQLVRF